MTIKVGDFVRLTEAGRNYYKYEYIQQFEDYRNLATEWTLVAEVTNGGIVYIDVPGREQAVMTKFIEVQPHITDDEVAAAIESIKQVTK